MTGAIVFQCTVWLGAGRFGPAHRCGATFASFAEYDAHYRAAHDITRRGPALPRARRDTERRTGQGSGQNEQNEGANAR